MSPLGFLPLPTLYVICILCLYLCIFFKNCAKQINTKNTTVVLHQEAVFHMHCPKSKTCMCLLKSLILKGGPTSMTCDITDASEASPDLIFSIRWCEVKTICIF